MADEQKQLTPYLLTVQLPMHLEDDEQAKTHAHLVMHILKPLLTLNNNTVQARLVDTSHLGFRVVPWET